MIRHIASVMRGTMLAQGLGILALPLLTRLYDPTDFGHFQVYQSATLLLVVFVSLRFEVALLRAKAGSELQATLVLCLMSTAAVTVLGTVTAAVVFAKWPSLHVQFPVSPLLIGLAIFLVGTFQFLSFLVTREQLYSVSANSKIAQAVSYVGIASVFGTLRVSLGLIMADALARLFGCLYLVRMLRNQGLLTIRGSSLTNIKAAAWKFREFPSISVFGGLINSLGAIITPVMIYAKFKPEVAGQFALVERALSFPIAIVVAAISQVYTATFAAMIRDDPSKLRKQFHDLLRMLLLVSVAPAVVVFFLAPKVFTLVFGSEWHVAGQLAQIMIPAYLTMFIYGGVNMTIMLLGRQVIQTIWEVLRAVCMVLLWGAIINPSMAVETVITMHALVLGGMSLLFIALAEYSVRRGPTKAAMHNA